MVAMGMRDRDEVHVGRRQLQLGELGGKLLGARRVADRSVDRLVGDGVGIAAVPQQPLRTVLDQIAGVREFDRLADIDAGRPACLVLRGVVAAVHDVQPIDYLRLRGGLCCGGAGEGDGDGQSDR